MEGQEVGMGVGYKEGGAVAREAQMHPWLGGVEPLCGQNGFPLKFSTLPCLWPRLMGNNADRWVQSTRMKGTQVTCSLGGVLIFLGAATTYHILGDLKQRNFSHPASKIKVLAEWPPVQALFQRSPSFCGVPPFLVSPGSDTSL